MFLGNILLNKCPNCLIYSARNRPSHPVSNSHKKFISGFIKNNPIKMLTREKTGNMCV